MAANSQNNKSNSTKRTGNTNRANTSNKNNSGTSNRVNYTKSSSQRDARANEIKSFIYLAVCIFLMCSLFGWCGIFGNVFAKLLFGLFGTAAYVIPVYIFVTAAFLLSNGASKGAVKRVICIALFIIAAGLIFQMTAGLEGINIKSLYKAGSVDKKGGGVLFGGLAAILNMTIGFTGAVIVTVLLIIIGIIIVLNFSIVGALKNRFDSISRWAEEDDDEEEFVFEEKRQKNVINNIKVLGDNDEDSNSNNSDKPRKQKKKPKNKVVKDEEIHELRPVKQDDFFNIDIPETKVSEVDFNTADFGKTENEPAKDFFEQQKLTTIRLKNTLNPDDFIKKDDTYNKSFADNNSSARQTKKIMTSNDFTVDSAFDDNANDKSEISNEQETVRKKRKTRESAMEVAAETADIAKAIEGEDKVPEKYKFPPVELLKASKKSGGKNGDMVARETAMKLKQTLENFGVKANITDYSCGPSVTRFEVSPELGVKVNKIVSLADDIKLNLAATDIRIEAPIPGKAAVGIEVPNKESTPVSFRELLESDEFKNFKPNLSFALGKDIAGQVVVADLAKMPHILIAGATGSGKSVCINTLIMSILYKAHPDDVKLIMIDPKQVELSVYNGIPHMLIPVVTDPKKAAGALNWAVVEMTNRYNLFSQYSVRNLEGYNEKVKAVTGKAEGNEELKKLPQIVIIVDELADLMMVAHGEVEDAIVRLSQLARAAGIHLVIATQRPSVDVITGLIKANVPSRIAMTVSSGVDSRTILDMNGAEKLLGKGDMLFYPTYYPKPVRVQGAFLSDEEIVDVVEFLKAQTEGEVYDEKVSQEIASTSIGTGASSVGGAEPEYDDYFVDAGKFIIGKDKASIGMLQRVYKIGFNRAARIMDQLAEAGVVGPEEGTKPRKIIMSMEEFENFVEENL